MNSLSSKGKRKENTLEVWKSENGHKICAEVVFDLFHSIFSPKHASTGE